MRSRISKKYIFQQIPVIVLATIAVISLSVAIRVSSRSVPLFGRPGALARWQGPAVERIPAQLASSPTGASEASTAACWPHSLKNLPRIQREVTQMEEQARGPALETTWQPAGLDLRRVSRAQGQFFLKHGSAIAELPISYRGCNSAPCVLNRLHGHRDDAAPGWVAYWVYLRTGALVAAGVGHVDWSRPWTCNERAVQLSEIQFSEEEFWMLAANLRAMPDDYGARAQTHAFRRFRRGYGPVRETIECVRQFHRQCGAPDGSACKDTYTALTSQTRGRAESREIILTDLAFSISENYIDPPDGQYLHSLLGQTYFAIPHEIMHHIDYAENWDAPWSQEPRWLAYSGWYVEPLGRNSSGGTDFRWALPDGAGSTLMSNYASTNPREDLADSLSHYRFKPDKLWLASNGKGAYLRERIFHGKSYRRADVEVLLQEALLSDALRDGAADIDRCFSGAGSAGHMTAFQSSSFTPSRPNSVYERMDTIQKECLNSTISTKLSRAVANLKAEWPEGCEYFRSGGNRRMAALLTAVSDQYATLLDGSTQNAEMVTEENRIRTAFSAEIDFRQVYLSCYSQADENARMACYSLRMSDASSRITASATRLSSETLTRLQTNYLTETSYTRARSETRLAVGSLLAELPTLVSSAAQTLWAQCTSPAVTESGLPSSPRSFPFSGGTRYIDPRILSCINEGFENAKRALLPQGETIGEFLRSEGAENYVFREWVDPALLSELDRLLDGAIRSQEGSLTSWRTAAQAALRTEVNRDSTWLRSAPLRDRALVRCRAHLEIFALPQIAGGASFSSIDEERGTLIDVVCNETIDSPQSRATISETRSRLTRALPALQTELERALSETRRACGTEPRACIEARWNSLVENARTQWAVNALGAEFASDEALVQSLSRRILNDRF